MSTEPELTEEQLEHLRQMADDSTEWWDAMEPILKGDTSGRATCPNCAGTARWHRDGRDWTMRCEECDWNAAGAFGGIRN